MTPSHTLGELATLVGGRLEGDATLPISGIAEVDRADASQIAVLSSKWYVHHLATSAAAAFMVTEEMEEHVVSRPRVVVRESQRALIQVIRHLHPRQPPEPGVHPTAVLERGVVLGEGVSVGAYAVLGEDVEVGDHSVVSPHVVVGRGSRLGRGCTLHPQVVLYPGTQLGDRVIIHSGTVLGADGFGYAFFDGAHQRIPHVGRTVIFDDVEIGANTAVDRGSIGDTVIEQGVKVDNLTQVAHNVRIGELSMLSSMVGISGSTNIGKGVWVGGQAATIDHMTIGDGARLAVRAGVLRDVPPGETVSGYPARPHREDLRRMAAVGHVPRMLERLKALEAEVKALRGNDGTE